ncbi:hypothetical protein KIPB_004451, partial [Kipferlia bialata]
VYYYINDILSIVTFSQSYKSNLFYLGANWRIPVSQTPPMHLAPYEAVYPQDQLEGKPSKPRFSLIGVLTELLALYRKAIIDKLNHMCRQTCEVTYPRAMAILADLDVSEGISQAPGVSEDSSGKVYTLVPSHYCRLMIKEIETGCKTRIPQVSVQIGRAIAVAFDYVQSLYSAAVKGLAADYPEDFLVIAKNIAKDPVSSDSFTVGQMYKDGVRRSENLYPHVQHLRSSSHCAQLPLPFTVQALSVVSNDVSAFIDNIPGVFTAFKKAIGEDVADAAFVTEVEDSLESVTSHFLGLRKTLATQLTRCVFNGLSVLQYSSRLLTPEWAGNNCLGPVKSDNYLGSALQVLAHSLPNAAEGLNTYSKDIMLRDVSERLVAAYLAGALSRLSSAPTYNHKEAPRQHKHHLQVPSVMRRFLADAQMIDGFFRSEVLPLLEKSSQRVAERVTVKRLDLLRMLPLLATSDSPEGVMKDMCKSIGKVSRVDAKLLLSLRICAESEEMEDTDGILDRCKAVFAPEAALEKKPDGLTRLSFEQKVFLPLRSRKTAAKLSDSIRVIRRKVTKKQDKPEKEVGKAVRHGLSRVVDAVTPSTQGPRGDT